MLDILKPLKHPNGVTFNDVQLAEDIAQETFLKIWQRPDMMTNRYSSIRPWLFTVARNLATDHKRMRMARAIEVCDAIRASSGPQIRRGRIRYPSRTKAKFRPGATAAAGVV